MAALRLAPPSLALRASLAAARHRLQGVRVGSPRIRRSAPAFWRRFASRFESLAAAVEAEQERRTFLALAIAPARFAVEADPASRGAPRGQLAGRVAIVTGSSRGIGRAVATALAREGASVIVNGREAAAARQAADEIAAAGGRARAVPGSAADPAVAAGLVAAAIDAFGGATSW
jgi:hypothetical protein